MKAALLWIIFLFFANTCLATPLTTEDEVAHGRIGTWPGSLAEECARKSFPQAEIVYLDTLADMAQNLRQNKIDAFAMNRLFVDELISSGQSDVEILGEALGKTGFSFVFTDSEKGKKLCREFNAFLEESRKNGNLSKWQQKWFSGDDERVLEKITLTGENGTLTAVTNPSLPPIIYMQNNEIAGYEAELMQQFCAAYGYDFQVTVATFETGMAGVSTGKFDIGFCSVEIRPERAKHFLFSDKTWEADCVLAVRADGSAGSGIIATLKQTFHDIFLRENRWKLFVSGLFTTVLITFVSVCLGTLLGFAKCLLYQENNRYLNALLNLLSRLFAGMPIVVLLMIFYYIIFGKVDVSGTFVAVAAFSILFGFSVFEMLRNATNNLPQGQREGALALGFSERQVFLRFLLPQAVRQAFPTYQMEIVGLLKSTAIVGYIAVQDLTKMADIIRAQTFDAFAPLVAITILYLAFVWLLHKITNYILGKLNPKRRSQKEILRGVTP